MRKKDLSPDRRSLLEPVAGVSGVFALTPPPARFDMDLREADGDIWQAQEALAKLRGVVVHLPNPDLITRTLSRREAVMSSRIEGTQAGIGELLEYEATHDAASLPADTRSTLNYVLALEQGLQAVKRGGRKALGEELVKELHRRLMSGEPDYRDPPGEYRSIQNWIGGLRIQEARFVPPRPDRIKACMKDLATQVLQYEPEGNAFNRIVVRAGIAHAQFETIHPFLDGNGRTGRLLIPLMLAAEDYPALYLAGPLYRHQREYFDALLQVQLRSRWDAWLRFFSQAVVSACEESMAVAARLMDLRDRWRDQVKGRRADSASRKLVEVLIGTPVVTAGDVKEMLSCSFPAANNAIADLVSLGILSDSGRKRNRFFVADAAIEILNRPQKS